MARAPWCFLLILIFSSTSRADGPIIIQSSPGYSRLRYCAQRGIDTGISPLGCTSNDCLCRIDIFASAIPAISNSAVSYCSGNTIDATAAMGLFISYCTVNGYTAPADAATITVPSPAGNIQSVYIYSAPHYSQLRSCAQRGVTGGIMGWGCETVDCLCRMDILGSAASSVSASASSLCYGNTIDVSSAMGVFIAYCTTNGYSAPSSLSVISMPTPAGNSLTVDLIYSPIYSSLRYCAQRGLSQGINEYGCDTNDCLCRADILSSAITAISTEVDGYCTSASADASSAIAAVVGYCSANAYTAVPSSNPSSPTGPTSARPGASSSLATATGTTSPGTSSSTSSITRTITIVFGVLFFVGVTVVVLRSFFRRRSMIARDPDYQPVGAENNTLNIHGPTGVLAGANGMTANNSHFHDVHRDLHNHHIGTYNVTYIGTTQAPSNNIAR